MFGTWRLCRLAVATKAIAPPARAAKSRTPTKSLCRTTRRQQPTTRPHRKRPPPARPKKHPLPAQTKSSSCHRRRPSRAHEDNTCRRGGEHRTTRCDRQARCNNIGPNEKYKSRAECVSKMQSDDGKSINADECPGGINEGNLNRCLKALREEGCGSPIGALERLESCKTDSICKK